LFSILRVDNLNSLLFLIGQINTGMFKPKSDDIHAEPFYKRSPWGQFGTFVYHEVSEGNDSKVDLKEYEERRNPYYCDEAAKYLMVRSIYYSLVPSFNLLGTFVNAWNCVIFV